MFFVTYVILFIGCLTITTMIHVLTIRKIEKFMKKRFLRSDREYKELDSCLNMSTYTLVVLFFLTLFLSTVLVAKYFIH